jgi:hypothetical protein
MGAYCCHHGQVTGVAIAELAFPPINFTESRTDIAESQPCLQPLDTASQFTGLVESDISGLKQRCLTRLKLFNG